MAATQFEPVEARRCFPCWDEPALKVNYFSNYTFAYHFSFPLFSFGKKLHRLYLSKSINFSPYFNYIITDFLLVSDTFHM